MSRMRDRIAALLASAGLLLAGAQSLPAAADGKSADGMWYVREYEGDVVSVSCEDKTVTEVTVPSEIDGKTVNMIEVDAFKDCTQLTKVTVPDTITVIEDYSFYECSSLQEINIPRSVKNIGFQAFYGCTSLTALNIPADCTDIEAFAFEGCSSLTGIHVAADNTAYHDEDGILFDKTGETLILYPSANPQTQYALPASCTSIYDYAFIGNPYLESVDISGVKEIGEDAFYFCTALKTAAIPDGITELKGAMFGKCESLESVQLPEGLTTIGESCFYHCMALRECDIPESVQTIGNYAFFNCPSYTQIHLTKNTTAIGDYALGFYLGDDGNPKRLPEFTVDAQDNTAAFDYCVKNSIRCTGGVTQNTVFIYIVVGVVVFVLIATITILIVQKRIQKRYELN